MGGGYVDEPISKRVKVSSGESQAISNGSANSDQGHYSLADSMAWLLSSQGDDEIVGSKRVIKKVEFVRIIDEALYSLGYAKTGACLEEESGITLHSNVVDLFMRQILDGQWDESVATLHEIGMLDENITKVAAFTILEQKYFELLHGEKIMDAVRTLRDEIAPLGVCNGRVRELCYLLAVFPSKSTDGTAGEEFKLKSRKELLEELQKLLPATVMIPENRLVILVEQALDLQRDSCRFHNSSVEEMSLLTDHQCGRDQIPSQTLQILTDHSDEVWFLQFSHNGKYLASSSADSLVIIWEVKVNGQVSLKHKLTGHQKPVSYISWSLDDKQILTCGVEETVRRWDISSGECLHVYVKNGLGLVSCGWSLDGKTIFSGVADKSICSWDLEGKELECYKDMKTLGISDIGICADGKGLVTVCKDDSVQLFEWETNAKRLVKEDQMITSFALSVDRKLLLVSLVNEELHLWNIDGRPKLIAKYRGHKRSRFVVRSCFGGLDQAFIASGSEDSQVYIWHRSSADPIMTLAGHSASVNCVSWNPSNPHMLASASDDRAIRIWGLNRLNKNRNGTHTNGAHCCNNGHA